MLRGRRLVEIDLKGGEGREQVRRLTDRADVLIDPFRPGVTERLGLGPDETRARNPRLVYARVTGWGQDGPWASAAGHDLNYIALAGPLAAIGRRGSPPPPPLNLIGDFGGGGMLLALGIAAALVERASSGEGQVVDAAMVDGAALQFAAVAGFMQMGVWGPERESNLLDGGAPFYDTYETADGRFVAIGALEPQFYAELLDRLGLASDDWPQYDRERWPALKRTLGEIFRTRTRDEWDAQLGGTDVCFAPVLGLDEAAAHPHNAARGLYQGVGGVVQPSPAPRFSRTPGAIRPSPGTGLPDWGSNPA
jgi:alpha-methylacyl-CoA racemase